MNRWTFLAVYVPCALACWVIEHFAGVRDGTGLSAAIGWGGGLVLTFAVFFLLGRRRGSAAAVRVERYRRDAERLRRDDPASYKFILAQADPAADRDPDAFVALFLAAAADEGLPIAHGAPMPTTGAPGKTDTGDQSLQQWAFPASDEGGVVTFDSDVHERAYQQVQAWVFQMFGESATPSDEYPTFSLPVGRSGLMVGVTSFGEDDACVDLYTWPVGDAELPDVAFRYLLETNASYRFGALNLQSGGTLLVEHQLVYSELSKERFSMFVHLIASVADEIALDLGARFLSGESVSHD